MSLVWSKDHQVSIKAFLQLTFSSLGLIFKQCQNSKQCQTLNNVCISNNGLALLMHLETSQFRWRLAHQSEMGNVTITRSYL